jgi:hypothetical protein
MAGWSRVRPWSLGLFGHSAHLTTPGNFPNHGAASFLHNPLWMLPFTHGGSRLNVFLVDKPIESESGHNKIKEEAAISLGEAMPERKHSSFTHAQLAHYRDSKARRVLLWLYQS